MFKRLLDLAYKRNWKEAIGFYLAYLLLALVILFLLGGAVGLLVGTEEKTAFDEGYRFGVIVATAYVLVLTGLLLRSKRLLGKNFGYLLFWLLSGLLTLVAGAFVGLIPAAYFSTKPAGAKKPVGPAAPKAGAAQPAATETGKKAD